MKIACARSRIHAVLSGFIISLHAAIPASGASADGRYCGEVFSSGILADVETTLRTDRHGRISGHYVFSEGKTVVTGTLEEQSKTGGIHRSLIWSDTYGKGKLVITFSKNNAAFDGKWGGMEGNPVFPWTGRKCDQPVADLFDGRRNIL